LSHADECRFDASELDFTLVDILEEFVVLVYLCVVLTRSVGDIVETLLENIAAVLVSDMKVEVADTPQLTSITGMIGAWVCID